MASRSVSKQLVLVGSVLCAFLGVFYWSFLIGRSFLWEDLLYGTYPAFDHLTTSLAAGRFPFWLSAPRCGIPCYGDPWIFYPPYWGMVFWVHDGSLSSLVIQWCFIIQLLMGGVFTFLFLRANRVNEWACVSGMVVFVFSAFLSLHIIHCNMGHAFLWLPLELLFVKRIAERQSPGRNYVYLILSIWMSFLAGFPQSVLYNAYFLGAYWLFLAWQAGREKPPCSRWRWLGMGFLECAKIATVFLIVGLLGAVVILSTMESWGLSHRQEFGFAQIADLSLPWYYLIHGLVPNFFGSVNGDGSGVPFWGFNKDTLEYTTWHAGAWMYWEFGFYAGQLALIAVVALLFNVRRLWTVRREAVFFLCALVPILWLMLGRYGGLFNVLYHIAPGFSMFRTPARLSGLLDFCLAVLVAVFVNALMERIPAAGGAVKFKGAAAQAAKERSSSPASVFNVRGPLIALAICYVVFLIWLLVLGEWAFPELKMGVLHANALNQTLLSILFFGLMAAVIWLMARIKSGAYLTIGAMALAALAFGDLYLAFHRFHQGKVKPEDYYADRNGLIAQMARAREQQGPFRFAQLRDGKISEEVIFPRNIGYLYPGYEALEGYVLFNLKGSVAFGNMTNEQIRLDIENVGVIANADRASGRVSVARYTNSLPRAKFYSSILPFETEQQIYEALDRGRLAYRQDLGLLSADCARYGISTNGALSGAQAEVRFIPKSPEEYQISYRTTVPGVIFLSESFYPGWEADGGRRPIIKAFGAFKGVVVSEPGSGIITVKFSPRVFKVGLTISLTTLLGLIGVWVLAGRKARKPVVM